IELRLLSNHQFLQLEQLNFNPETLQAIINAVSRPEGLILFTGPTGSGKTTSLYAVLQLLNKPDRKIVSLEDPVEYRIEGIEQVQIQPATEVQAQYSAEKEKQEKTRGTSVAGFDFAEALKAALRQDPDIIMVGEIRDRETAEIAVNASLTGHMVLSTLHTNSSSAAFARLIQMGVPKYLLADAITLVVAQRLVRKLCDNCHGAKCERCNNTGFHGRILISEHYQPDSQTVELIKREATLSEFDKHFQESGNKSLLQDGLEKVAQGLTTEEEIRSVVG
ncbi:MAG: ATPase, T2SS/T4P/T4SS family, partial [Patescibacteria group bacterium]